MKGRIIRIFHAIAILIGATAIGATAGLSSAATISAQPIRSDPAARAPFMLQAKSLEETPSLTKAVFKNGLKVLVNEYRAHPVVSVQAYIHTDVSENFHQDIRTAHLVAAMIGRGGDKPSVGTIRQNMMIMGGLFRTSTHPQYTLFEIVVPAAQWQQALDLHADALLYPQFSETDLKLEARLLQGEARSLLSDPSTAAGEYLIELGFNRPAAGTGTLLASDDIHDHSIQTLAAFHEKHYTPANITLVISGDVRSVDIMNRVIQVYDKPAGKMVTPTARYRATPHTEFRYRAVEGAAANPHLLFGFHGVAEDAADYRALEVMSALLGMGEGSLLSAHLKYQRGLAYSVRSEMRSFLNRGFLLIEVETSSIDIDRTALAVLTELELLKNSLPDDAAMERAFAQLERSFWKRLENVTDRAKTIAHYEFLSDWKQMDRYVSELRKIQPSDIRRVATRYLQLQNCFYLELLPDTSTGRKTTTDIVRKTFEDLLVPAAKEELERRAKMVIPALDIPEHTGSFSFSATRYPFVTASILRGPELYIREDHTLPLVDVGIFFPGGMLNENEVNSGVTEFMTRLMLWEDTTNGGDNWHRRLELYGGTIEAVVAEDYFGFYLSILSRNADPGLKTVLSALKNPSFSRENFDRQKELQRAAVARRDTSRQLYEQILRKALFDDFAYALPATGTEESLKSITPDYVRQWYDRHVRDIKPVVVFIGDVHGTSPTSYFIGEFSGSHMMDGVIRETYADPPEKGTSIELKGKGVKELLLIGVQAPPMDDEDRYAATVLQHYLGETGLLVQQVRDHLGAAHSLSLTYESRLRGGVIIVRAGIQPGSRPAVLESILDEMERIHTEPISYRDLRGALNSASGRHDIESQYRMRQMLDLTGTVLSGNRLEDYVHFSDRIRKVTENDLKELSRRIFNREKAVILHVQGNIE
jgi:zinc protease